MADQKPIADELRWNGQGTEKKPGDIIHLNKQLWMVIVSAQPARTKTLSEADEDMGEGQEGQVLTYQKVTYRPATEAEIAAEQARRQAARDAKPRKAIEAKLAELASGGWLRLDTPPAGAVWASAPLLENVSGPLQYGDRIRRGMLPDGTEIWQHSWTTLDDHRISYFVPATGEAEQELRRRNRAIAFYFIEKAGPAFAAGMVRYQPGMTMGDLIPETDEERERLARGVAREIERRNMRQRLTELEALGIISPDDFKAIAACYGRVGPVDPRRPDEPGQNDWHCDDEKAAPHVFQAARGWELSPLYRDRSKAVDLVIEAGIQKVEPRSARSAPVTWDHLLPKAPNFGLQPREVYDYLEQLKRLAAERGTLELYQAQIEQRQAQAVLSEAMVYRTHKWKKGLAERMLQRESIDDFDRAVFASVFAPEDRERLTKKVQAALAARGL